MMIEGKDNIADVSLLQHLEQELASAKRLNEDIKALRDRLNNGIRYDEDLNVYVVVWTARELEEARKEADEIYKVLGGDE